MGNARTTSTKRVQDQSVPLVYDGITFRSRLEAQWAVFFDACGVDWEYEPPILWHGNDTKPLLHYFLLHNVGGRVGGDLYVAVVETMETEIAPDLCHSGAALYVVGQLPEGNTMDEITACVEDMVDGKGSKFFDYFNFEISDDGHCAAHLCTAHPGVNFAGKFELFGDSLSDLCNMDDAATLAAYKVARSVVVERVDLLSVDLHVE